MPKTKQNDLTLKFTHALRGLLTVYNFADSEKEKADVMSQISTLVDRTDSFLTISDLAEQREITDFGKIVGQVLDHLNSNRVVIDHSGDIQLKCHSRLTYALLYELIENALRYSEGSVRASTHVVGKRVVVRIEDEGPGLDQHVERLVGEPFIPSDNPHAGIGLGLAIVWSIVQAIDGSLVFQNETSGLTVMATLDLV